MPLSDPEIETLWELAASSEETLRQRFMEEAIRNPATTRQLKNRREVALNATVGLDLRRREVGEGMLTERLSAGGVSFEQATDLAMTLATLGDLSRDTASRVAVTLTQAMNETTDPDALQSLSQELSAVLAKVDLPNQGQRVGVVLTVLSLHAHNNGLLSGVPLLQPALEPLPCRLSIPQLVELLKHPLCVGEARRVVLEQLAKHYGRPFADQWEFVHFARQHEPKLDLTKPPVAPRDVTHAAR